MYNNSLNLNGIQLEALRDGNYGYIPQWRWQNSDFVKGVLAYLDQYSISKQDWKNLIWTIEKSKGMSERTLKEICKRNLRAAFMQKTFKWDYDRIKQYLFPLYSWVDVFEEVFEHYSDHIRLCYRLITDICCSEEYGVECFWLMPSYGNLSRYLMKHRDNPYALLTLYELEQYVEFPEDMVITDGRILKALVKAEIDLQDKFNFLMSVDWDVVDFFEWSYRVIELCNEIDAPYEDSRTFLVFLKLLPKSVQEDPRFFAFVPEQYLISGEIKIFSEIDDDELIVAGASIDELLTIRFGDCMGEFCSEERAQRFLALNRGNPNQTFEWVKKHNLFEKIKESEIYDILMREEKNKGTPLYKYFEGE